MTFRSVLFFILLSVAAASALADQDIKFSSPDNHIQVGFGIAKNLHDLRGVPYYNIAVDSKPLIATSMLGLQLSNSGAYSNLKIVNSEHRSSDSTYVMPFGKNHTIRNQYEEYSFNLEENNFLRRQIQIVFRVYNDGVAFRYFLPDQKTFKEFTITDELTEITPSVSPKVYGIPLQFNSSYEWYYRIGNMNSKSFEYWDNLALPSLLEFPDRHLVAITEASLTDYAGMYIAKSKEHPETFVTHLAPSLKDKNIKVQGTTPFYSPWRVFMIGDSPKVLVDSDIVYNLNEPSKIEDTSWIHPGKIQFPWWNGYIVPNPDPRHKPGLNTWTLKHYIDFCAANKIPYHSIDGFETAWYGGAVYKYEGGDITKSIPEIDMPEVLRYARERNVGTRLWMHAEGLAKNMADTDAHVPNHEDALTTYEKWGIEGIMVDFLNRDDQEAVQFYNKVLERTAAHHLTVSFHGVFKPTGLARTYPNLLTQEAVLGSEYDKWGVPGSTPDHEVLIAFIRMLAGPLDTHQGSFRPVAPQYYKPTFIGPRTMGTLARQLAMYVVYENHLPMLADFPEAYTAQPQAFHFVKQVPVYWDESHMVAGEIGQFITMARRKGTQWYIGSITDQEPRNIDLSLQFLGPGKFVAEIYSDGEDSINHPEEVILSKKYVTAADALPLKLAPAGGNAVRIYKLIQEDRR